MKEAQLAGITPYVLRLAAYYAALGVGEYHPRGYAQFDCVTVRELFPWRPGPTPTESALVLIVEFFHQNHRLRYVEFALTPAGFGGDPVMQLLPGNKKSTDQDAGDKDHSAPSDQPPSAGT